VFNEDDQLAADFKRNVVYPVQKQQVPQGVYGNGQVGGQGNAFQGAVQFAQQIGVAEKKGKNAVFVLSIRAHIESIGD
jgi:hypothetical protein